MNAHTCYIYIRGEYFMKLVLQKAIDEAYDAKLIGKNAAKSGWISIYSYIEAQDTFVERRQPT